MNTLMFKFQVTFLYIEQHNVPVGHTTINYFRILTYPWVGFTICLTSIKVNIFVVRTYIVIG